MRIIRAAALAAIHVLAACGAEATTLPPSSQSVSVPPPASSPSAAPPSVAPSPAPRSVVLFDPHDATDPHVKALVGPDRLTPAAQKEILDRVFGSTYLTDARRCVATAGTDLAENRKAGQIVPLVSQAITGAFTSRSASQTLFVIANGECGATHADNYGTVTLAVVDGNALGPVAPGHVRPIVLQAATVIVPGGSSIDRVVDVDGDGVDELTLTIGFTNQGYVVESARLVRFDSGELVTVKDFGKVLESNCAAGVGTPSETYSIVRAVVSSGSPPRFELEKKTGPCR